MAAAAQLQDMRLDSSTVVRTLELAPPPEPAAALLQAALREQSIDLLLCCSPGDSMRNAANEVCLALQQVWVDAELAPASLSGTAALCCTDATHALCCTRMRMRTHTGHAACDNTSHFDSI